MTAHEHNMKLLRACRKVAIDEPEECDECIPQDGHWCDYHEVVWREVFDRLASEWS